MQKKKKDQHGAWRWSLEIKKARQKQVINGAKVVAE